MQWYGTWKGINKVYKLVNTHKIYLQVLIGWGHPGANRMRRDWIPDKQPYPRRDSKIILQPYLRRDSKIILHFTNKLHHTSYVSWNLQGKKNAFQRVES